MRKARILVNDIEAGVFGQLKGGKYKFTYHSDYQGAPVSLTMPLINNIYEFDVFPPFFEGLLPEGILLEALLRKYKIDRNDYFAIERLGLNQKTITGVLLEFQQAIPRWQELIGISFLSQEMQEKYLNLLEARSARLDF